MVCFFLNRLSIFSVSLATSDPSNTSFFPLSVLKLDLGFREVAAEPLPAASGAPLAWTDYWIIFANDHWTTSQSCE
jgi:hypothetical protein